MASQGVDRPITTSRAVSSRAVSEGSLSDSTVPTSWYWDPGRFDLELSCIHDRAWHAVGAVDRLQQPGDHIVAWTGRTPIVVVRHEDGALRGFVNVCRHRGYAVATHDGNRRLLRCGYHGWSYDLDGHLRKAPGAEHEPGFDMCKIGLVQISVDEVCGVVFAAPHLNAVPFREAHPEFEPIAHAHEVDITAYERHSRRTYEVCANWKLWLDNATECYHCGLIHSSSFGAAFDVSPESHTEILTGHLLCGFAPPADPRSEGRGVRTIQMFPSTLVSQDDSTALVGMIVPVAPELTHFTVDVFANPACSAAAVDASVEMWHQTFVEDQAAVEVQQRGLRSGRVHHGILMTNREPKVARLQQLVLDACPDTDSAEAARERG